MSGSYGARFQLKLGIAELAHLGKIQAFELRLRRYALTHNQVNDVVDSEDQAEDTSYQSRHTDQLGYQLARVAVEQAGDIAGDAVPRPAVVTLAIREEADRDYA